jgi:CheY-like chemotaxis protein
MRPPHLLTVGTDVFLQETRRLVLESAGLDVVSAFSMPDAVRCIAADTFDLVLLCHTIPEKDRRRFACLIRASGSSTPVVALSPYEVAPDGFMDGSIESEPGPMLAGIREILSRRTMKHYPGVLRSQAG